MSLLKKNHQKKPPKKTLLTTTTKELLLIIVFIVVIINNAMLIISTITTLLNSLFIGINSNWYTLHGMYGVRVRVCVFFFSLLFYSFSFLFRGAYLQR